MKTKKSTAFWVAVISILAVYFTTLLNDSDVAKEIGPSVVFSLALAGGFYQGTNVADNALKGKFYRSELDGK